MVLLWYLYRIFMVFTWYFLPTQSEGKAKARHLKNVSSTTSRLRGLKARHLIGQSVRAVIL